MVHCTANLRYSARPTCCLTQKVALTIYNRYEALVGGMFELDFAQVRNMQLTFDFFIAEASNGFARD